MINYYIVHVEIQVDCRKYRLEAKLMYVRNSIESMVDIGNQLTVLWAVGSIVGR